MEPLLSLWNFTWYDIAIGHVVIGTVIVLVTLFVWHIVFRQCMKLAKAITQKTKTRFDNIIAGFVSKLEWPLLLIIVLWELMSLLTLPAILQGILSKSITIISTVLAVLLINTIVDYSTQENQKKNAKKREKQCQHFEYDGEVFCMGVCAAVSA